MTFQQIKKRNVLYYDKIIAYITQKLVKYRKNPKTSHDFTHFFSIIGTCQVIDSDSHRHQLLSVKDAIGEYHW